jgi:membrane-bound serine protease (ClpP class)
VTLATRGLAFETVLPDWRQRLLSVIANPSFALILMMIGIYGLMFEFSSPGFGVPGTVGAICLLLALFALQLLPVNYAGLALILLGMALLAAEVVTPTLGVLGVGGVIAFITGGLLLFDRDIPGFGVPLPLIFGLAASSAAVVLLGGGMALRARRRPVVSGSAELVGAEGVVLQRGDAGIWAQVRGERWRVTSVDPLQPGQPIRVLGRQGLTLQVGAQTVPANEGDNP